MPPPNLLAAVTAPLLTTTTDPFNTELFRSKRQIWYGGYGAYDNGYYGYGYFSQWTRILLSILAVVAIILCCLVPCICALGIWFAGWFGLRNRRHMANKTQSNGSPYGTNSYAQQQPIVPQQQTQTATAAQPQQNSTPSGSASPRERVDTYVYEEKRSDHYYHRPPSPRPYDEYPRYFTSSKL